MMRPARHFQSTLTGLQEAVHCKGPGLLSQGVLLLYDYTQPHAAHTTVNFSNTQHWKILPYPPYSPDLALLDFHLFPKLMKHLQGLQFQTDEDIQEEVKWWLHLQDAPFYHRGFDSDLPL
jgi:hypothetical protein